MNTIWKYELEFEAITRLQVPKNAEMSFGLVVP